MHSFLYEYHKKTSHAGGALALGDSCVRFALVCFFLVVICLGIPSLSLSLCVCLLVVSLFRSFFLVVHLAAGLQLMKSIAFLNR